MASDEESNNAIVCANPDCRVAETGRCVEGLTLDGCPDYGQEPDNTDMEEELDDEFSQHIVLSSADVLTLEEASQVLRECETRVIAVLGPSDSGKTSLIASLYDLFQEATVAGVEFGRSRTLHAFERACHNARMASRRSEPHMNRTPIGGVRFYHLEIANDQDGNRLAFLLADRAGEEYRIAAEDINVVGEFLEITRADMLTVLVDGERLLNTGDRHNLRSDINLMLQGLYEGGGLRAGVRLALVLTKLDAINTSNHKDRALRDFDSLFNEVDRLFGNAIAEVVPFQIAALPKTNELPRGTGVADLLRFWLLPKKMREQPLPSPINFKRVFARLRPLDEPVEEIHD